MEGVNGVVHAPDDNVLVGAHEPARLGLQLNSHTCAKPPVWTNQTQESRTQEAVESSKFLAAAAESFIFNFSYRIQLSLHQSSAPI
eukprot:1190614-Prorocentrum_minimum.AAC.1